MAALTTATERKAKRQPSMPSGYSAPMLVAYSAPEKTVFYITCNRFRSAPCCRAEAPGCVCLPLEQ
jgi:hypothetical protein